MQENQSSGFYDKVRHKLACTVTEESEGLEISDFGRSGTVLFV